MFQYSDRADTYANKNMEDDVDLKVKNRRLTEIINLQNELSAQSNRRDVGRTFEVLVEGTSKRSEEKLFGRTSQNKVVVFDRHNFKTGDYVVVRIDDCSSATLIGTPIVN